jgi:lysophospholipase L1-like esterase
MYTTTKILFKEWRKFLIKEVFRKGMKDPDPASKAGPVAKIQQKLMALNPPLLPPNSDDGDYGNNTKDAVYKFQQKVFPNDETEWDGKAGTNTLTKLGLKNLATASPRAKSKSPLTIPKRGEGSGPRALIIGDSHVDWSSFGKDLTRELEAKGYEVYKYGVGGSAAYSWLRKRSGLLSQLNSGGPWDLLLVSLGTNDMANSKKGCRKKRDKKRCLARAARRQSARIAAVIKKIKAEKTVWIGPPSLRGSTKGLRRWYHPDAAAAIYDAGGPSGVDVAFDSRDSTRGAGKDGIHPTGALGAAWAKAVATAV